MATPAVITRTLPNRGPKRGANRDAPNMTAVTGRKARPAPRAESPRTPWKNWVRKKNMANIPLTTSTRTA